MVDLIMDKKGMSERIPHGLKAIGPDGIISIDLEKKIAIGFKKITEEDCGYGAHFDSLKGLPLVVPGATLEEWGYQVGLVLLSGISGCQMAMPIKSTRINNKFVNVGDEIIIKSKLVAKDPFEKYPKGNIEITNEDSTVTYMTCSFTFKLVSCKVIKRLFPPIMV